MDYQSWSAGAIALWPNVGWTNSITKNMTGLRTYNFYNNIWYILIFCQHAWVKSMFIYKFINNVNIFLTLPMVEAKSHSFSDVAVSEELFWSRNIMVNSFTMEDSLDRFDWSINICSFVKCIFKIISNYSFFRPINIKKLKTIYYDNKYYI